MRLADFGGEAMLGERSLDPRNEIAAKGLVIDMLQLAPAAFREMTAGRFLVMESRGQRSVVEQDIAGNSERYVAAARRHAIAARGDAHDRLVHCRSAKACGIASTRSSAIIPGPAISAARP